MSFSAMFVALCSLALPAAVTSVHAAAPSPFPGEAGVAAAFKQTYSALKRSGSAEERARNVREAQARAGAAIERQQEEFARDPRAGYFPRVEERRHAAGAATDRAPANEPSPQPGPADASAVDREVFFGPIRKR